MSIPTTLVLAVSGMLSSTIYPRAMPVITIAVAFLIGIMFGIVLVVICPSLLEWLLQRYYKEVK